MPDTRRRCAAYRLLMACLFVLLLLGLALLAAGILTGSPPMPAPLPLAL